MKRVIEGKTYNTDTATIVASYEYTDEKENEVTVGLYQTRGGTFFGVHSWVEEDSEGDPADGSNLSRSAAATSTGSSPASSP